MKNFARVIIIYMLLFPGTGYSTSLKVSWNPNPESNLGGYEVAHGTVWPHFYTEHLDAQDHTGYLIENVVEGVFHYVSVRAYIDVKDDCQKRIYSDYADEVSIYVPLFIRPDEWQDD